MAKPGVKSNRLSIAGVLVLLSPAILVYFFSTTPSYTYHEEDEAMLVVSFKKTTEKVTLCDEAELKKFKETAKGRRKHMRKNRGKCGSRERVPMEMVVNIDSEEKLRKLVDPSGLRSDGVVYIYERFYLTPGEHRLVVSTRDYREDEETEIQTFDQTVSIGPQRIVVIEFDPQKNDYVVIDK